MQVKGLHHAGLTVANLDRSIAFYRELIADLELVGPWLRTGPGVGQVTGYPGCSVRQAFLRSAGNALVIELLEYIDGGVAIDPANGNAGAVHFCLIIDDLDAHYERLIGLGHRFVSAPITTSKNPVLYGRVAYLIDPDGIRVELFQPLADP